MKGIFRKKISLTFVSLLLCLSLVTACNTKTPITVTSTNSNSVIEMQAVVDSVTIQGIKLNRGSLENPFIAMVGNQMAIGASYGEYFMGKKFAFPKTLKFGQTLMAISVNNEPIIEVEVQTDQGPWTFTFN